MSKRIPISKRLQMIASLLTPDVHFADIGSDHAYLPCYICLRNRNARAIAGEVVEGPYRSAKQTVDSFQLSHQIDVRLGDGLSIITRNDTIEEVVIAGMGARLIMDIIKNGYDKLATVKRMILQPNNHADRVRTYFLRDEFSLVNELILEENGHYYEILVVEKKATSSIYDEDLSIEKQLMFGPRLVKEKPNAFVKKWQSELQKLEAIISDIPTANKATTDKRHEFIRQANLIREVLS